MAPVNVFNGSLVGDAFREAQASALVCIRAERGVTLRREGLGRVLRQIDRRAEGDNDARKQQRNRAAAKNVSVNFVVRFHSYISLLRREPRVAVDPAGRGPGGAPGETPNELDAGASCPFFVRHGKIHWTWLRGWLCNSQIFSGIRRANVI